MVEIEGAKTPCLVDTGARVNTVTPEFIRQRGLHIAPLKELDPNHPISISGVAGSNSTPLGFVIMRVTVPEVKGYTDDQVFFVLHDPTYFGRRIPIILGTCTIGRVINTMKESEFDVLPEAWDRARFSDVSKAAVHRANLLLDENYATKKGTRPSQYDEIAHTQHDQLIPAFATVVVHAKVKNFMMGCSAYVMGHGIRGSSLASKGLEVQNVYAEIHNGSTSVPVIVRNKTPEVVKLERHQALARITLANKVPPPQLKPGTWEALKKEFGIGNGKDHDDMPRLSVDERQRKLEDQLDLSGLEKWTPELANAAKDLLMEYHDIFALEPNELGCVSDVKHEIRLTDNHPYKDRFSNIPKPMVDEVREHLREMLEAGAIRPSQSPWNNAIVLVRKKDGGLRFCIDFRKLNERTVKDSHPLPRINDALDRLVGARHFSTLDLKSGFWQIEMDEASKQYTAFSAGNFGFYECNRMPFGLCNAPATFQRCMQNCLGELNLTYALIYLDDIIVFSDSESSHLDRLRMVFQRIRENNLKLKPSKCKFFQEEIEYLAHEVTKDGVKPSRKNLQAIEDYQIPQTYTEIRGFVNMVGHYRRFIKNFARIAKPLTDFLSGKGSGKKRERIDVGPAGRDACAALKKALTEAPVLAFADFDKEFLLETDASKLGLGAALSQKQDDGKYHPVAYASRCLSASEKNYHSSKLEFLALKWAVTEKLKEYLAYKPFVVKTDNNPLTYIMKTPNLDATGLRWVGELAKFQFKLEYQRGRDNTIADALSREPEHWDEGDVRNLMDVHPCPVEEFRVGMCGLDDNRLFVDEAGTMEWMKTTVLGTAHRAEVHRTSIIREGESIDRNVGVLAQNFDTIHVTDWGKEQAKDPHLSPFIHWIRSRKTYDLGQRLGLQLNNPEVEAIYRQRKNLYLERNMLYIRDWRDPIPDGLRLFVVPTHRRQQALDGLHRDAGHQGVKRTQSLVKERFWWPGMMDKVAKMVKGCGSCTRFEAQTAIAPLHPIVAYGANDLVHADFLKIEIVIDPKESVPRKCKVPLLVIQDHFTKYARVVITEDEKAETTARALYKEWFSVFGFPAGLITDQGRNFTSRVVEEMCKMLRVKKLRTSSYHPMTNGQVERFNRTLVTMIGRMELDMKLHWRDHLDSIVHAYNSTRNAVTGYSPHYLMFGRRPRLPVDFIFPTIGDEPPKSVPEYVAEITDAFKDARQKAIIHTTNEAMRQKRYYDRRVRGAELRPGDIVRVKQDAFVGKRKILNRWEEGVWEVERQFADGVPTFVLKN